MGDSDAYDEPEECANFRQRQGLVACLFRSCGFFTTEFQRLPCCGCLTMRKTSDIDSVQMDKLRPIPGVQTSRRFLTCVMSNPVSLEHGTPWLKYGYDKHVILCRKCEKTETNANVYYSSSSMYIDQKPNHGMRSQKLCSACWEGENKQWVEFKKVIREDMQERQAYLTWMNHVDSYGLHSAGNRPSHKFTSTLKR